MGVCKGSVNGICQCCGSILVDWPIRTSIFVHGDEDSNRELLSERLYNEGIDPQGWLRKNNEAVLYEGYEVEIVLNLYEDGRHEVVEIKQ